MSSRFLHNIRTCMCIRKKCKNGEFSPCHFWLYYTCIYKPTLLFVCFVVSSFISLFLYLEASHVAVSTINTCVLRSLMIIIIIYVVVDNNNNNSNNSPFLHQQWIRFYNSASLFLFPLSSSICFVFLHSSGFSSQFCCAFLL